MNNQEKLTAWFARFDRKMKVGVPRIIAVEANKYFRESFQRKGFAGVPWKPAKRPGKTGTLMQRKGNLVNSIRTEVETKNLVRVSAGSALVKYAKIQNQGGVINRAPRTENFVRNRYKRGPKSKYFGGMGAFKKGTTPGEGLSFKAYKIIITGRQYMGHAAELNKRIIIETKVLFNTR